MNCERTILASHIGFMESGSPFAKAVMLLLHIHASTQVVLSPCTLLVLSGVARTK